MLRKLSNKSFVSVSVLLMAVLCSSAAQAFILSDMNSERTTLQAHIGDGKWSIVMLWQLECVACEEQKPAFNAFNEKYKDYLARSIAVSIDGVERKTEIDARIAKHNDGYLNLIAFSDVYRRQYKELTGNGFRSAPTFLIFGPEGQLRGTQFGYIDFEAIAQNMAAVSGLSN